MVNIATKPYICGSSYFKDDTPLEVHDIEIYRSAF